MVAVADTKLTDLSSRYQRPVLCVIERSARSTSLLILLSIVPAMIAFPFRTVDEENASFGLRCLETFHQSAENNTSAAQNTEATWNSPLSVWLTSTLTDKMRFFHFDGAILISSSALAIFLILTFQLVKSFAGNRVAFWSLVFLVTHPLVIRMAIQPASEAIGLLCSVLSLLLYLSHLRHSRKLLSYYVLFAGLAVGGVILSSGLLSVLTILLIVSLSQLAQRTTVDEQPTMRVSWMRLQTVGVLLLTAFAISGWWVMKSAIHQGSAFWGDWMFGTSVITSEVGSQSITFHEAVVLKSVWVKFFALSGVLSGLFLVGAGSLSSRTFHRESKPKLVNSEVVFLFVWFGLAMSFWILAQTVPISRNWVSSTSSVALAIPLTFFAGICIAEFTDRNLGLGWVVAVCEIGLLVALASPQGSIESYFYWSPVIVVSIVLLSYCAVWFCRHRFRLAKILTVSAILTFPIFNISKSWEQIRTSDKDSNTLSDFHTALSKLSHVENILVSSSLTIPLPLKYSLRSRWPDATWMTTNQSQTSKPEYPPSTLLIRWESFETKDVSGLQSLVRFQPVTDSVLYRHRELRAYFSGQ